VNDILKRDPESHLPYLRRCDIFPIEKGIITETKTLNIHCSITHWKNEHLFT
jgi:hypothetical protein